MTWFYLFVKAFGKESVIKYALEIASRLRREVKEEKFLKSKDFLIISYKASISSFCFLYIALIAAATADVIALITDYLTIGYMSAIGKL